MIVSYPQIIMVEGGAEFVAHGMSRGGKMQDYK